jgi:glycosyltransferase involved in cell wall biosynthesis
MCRLRYSRLGQQDTDNNRDVCNYSVSLERGVMPDLRALDESSPIRVLYSFPHKLGADRICYTAWQQVNGLAAAGACLLVFPGSLTKPVPAGVKVQPTLARGKLRIPYKVLGSMRAFALHDYIVSGRLEKLAGEVDIVHTWPLGAMQTLMTASKLGIPTVLERPNANTRFAMEVVQQECERLGIALPRNHEHAYNAEKLRKEEEEYAAADRLLCPSEFVVKTFLDKGYSKNKLVRHFYGFDERVYFPENRPSDHKRGLTMLFVGVCAVRKGVHFALEAWLQSPASKEGSFLIAGEFLPAYENKLASMLAHPSVHVLGHRNDVPELMRKSDMLVLPSIEEGFGLVIAEAMGSGCIPLASDACTDVCRHMENGLVHRVGDVAALTEQITMLHEDRRVLENLRAASLRASQEITWTAAGARLLSVYREICGTHGARSITELQRSARRTQINAATRSA